MEIGKNRTGIVLAITVLWVLITICGWTGRWFEGLLMGVLLMLLHMMMGAAQNGKLDRKLFMYPLLTWFVVWIAGFFFSKYYSDLFLNMAPTFKILGFHPSFAAIILAYWIGGVLTLTLGLVKFDALWLSDENWDAFKRKMDQLNQKEGAHE
ncbi:hypothetical protein [Fusibacter sp. 3D3]|uniref:hypothetical protein n=1 Tax=Fusibacter sp. 3D3 TaxID=1048380 RepID=UPI00085359A5|nr:hypothetical protein [Fusibacter sp. 3D3]GAU78343.1 hypothetical protein F3D3_2976 [Fusibacter sp. 3D3]